MNIFTSMDRHKIKPNVSKFPGKNAEKLVKKHHNYAAPSTHIYKFAWDVAEEGIGPFCKDIDGNILMDFTSHVAASPFGYQNPKIVERIQDLLDMHAIEPGKMAGQDFYYDIKNSSVGNSTDLMEELVDISSEYGMDTVFLSNTGAEAVENAIKIAYHNKNGKYGITFQNAFHGRTLGTLSLNRSKGLYREHFPEISGIESVPYCQSDCDNSTCDCGFFVNKDQSLLDTYIGTKDGFMNPEEISYIILEPIQGEGGYNVPSDRFMDEIQNISENYDIHIISDEVQAGIGRTGEWWGVDNYSIEPDIISVAKPARIGATISKEEIYPEKKSRLSSTWGAGDVIAIAQGVATIKAIKEENILSHVNKQGKNMYDRINDIESEDIIDVRQIGLMIGVEMVSKERKDQIIKECSQNGLLLMPCGKKTVRVLPPLDVTDREIDIFESIFTSCLK